ncbi:hypothetical protein D3C74_465920 [compost metagenome]
MGSDREIIVAIEGTCLQFLIRRIVVFLALDEMPMHRIPIIQMLQTAGTPWAA